MWRKCNGSCFHGDRSDLQYPVQHGRRDGYERGGSACYCKDLTDGEIRLLYEY
ncbi:MAG: hypothetical protein HFI62_01720 [Lachnospiraceae bacterium]|nr:hypothetical protein [Lachnospiraceae bacterium]